MKWVCADLAGELWGWHDRDALVAWVTKRNALLASIVTVLPYVASLGELARPIPTEIDAR